MKRRPIGVFDSGLGGLTVAGSIRKYLPEEDMVYFGDTARVPYGNKSRSTIVRFSHEIMSFLLQKRVKMVVVACNTASSLSLEALKREYPIPVVGVIKPGVREAVRVSRGGRIGVIGTDSTISSGAYEKELSKIAPDHKVFSKACPLFVPIVESRFRVRELRRGIVDSYLASLKSRNIDTLILGCTHYPILKKVIREVMGGVDLVDSSVAVAKYVKTVLADEDLGTDRAGRNGVSRFFVSDAPESFMKTARIFLGENIKASKVTL